MDMPASCPNCKSHYLKPIGIGTQKVEEQLEAAFTKAKVIRYDVDTTRNKDGHHKLLEKFAFLILNNPCYIFFLPLLIHL